MCEVKEYRNNYDIKLFVKFNSKLLVPNQLSAMDMANTAEDRLFLWTTVKVISLTNVQHFDVYRL